MFIQSRDLICLSSLGTASSFAHCCSVVRNRRPAQTDSVTSPVQSTSLSPPRPGHANVSTRTDARCGAFGLSGAGAPCSEEPKPGGLEMTGTTSRVAVGWKRRPTEDQDYVVGLVGRSLVGQDPGLCESASGIQPFFTDPAKVKRM